jgi:malate dehydrogenase (quinone)
VLERCFPDRIAGWTPTLRRMVPTYGDQLADDEERAAATLGATAEALHIHA